MMFLKYKAINPISVLGLLVIVVSAICCTPILNNPSYYVMTGVVTVLCIVVGYKNRYLQENQSLILFIALYIFLSAFYKLFEISSAAWGNYMNQWFSFVPLMIMMLILGKTNGKNWKWIWWLIVVIAFYNIADNINLSILYPQIHTGRIYMDEEFLKTLNAGGSMFYNFSLMFFIVCFFVFLNTKSKMTKIVSFLAATIAAVFIVWYCLKGSVVVYFFLSVVLLLIAKRAKKVSLFMVISIVVAIVLLFLVDVYKEIIIKFFIQHSPGERLTVRLITLLDIENEEANETTITGRTNLYLLSLKTWLSDASTFIFGIGDHRAAFHAMETGIGQHSDFFDLLARYGCVGALIIGTIILKSFKFILSLFDDKYRLQLAIIFLIYLLCGFTKQIFFPSMGFVMFLFLPLSASLVNQKDSTK